MDYTNFNMRLDNQLRNEVYPILEQYGLTPSQAVRMFFNQIAKTGKIPLSFDWGVKDLEPTDKLLKIIEQNEKDRLEGKVSTYNSFEEMMADLGK